VPPPTIIDPGLGAHHHLDPGLRACYRLGPDLIAHRHLIPNPEHTIADLVLKSIIVDLAAVIIDLDAASLGLCLPISPPPRCCHQSR
jgi:hypothetical protein